MAAALVAGLISGPALAGCPWIVQPSEAIGGDLPDYEITYNGATDPALTYYAFTVTDHDLAWQLSSGSGLSALDDRGRPLTVIDQDDRLRYRADTASVMPLTIYLVVSTSPMAELDMIAAAFEPARPIAVGLRLRGASDSSGPLPHRSLPGVEIHYASSEPTLTELGAGRLEYQLCAYQVLIR
ncbi:MAG: hypothetical protein OEU92_12720 [Alphaproteobacteria bacterium]|nr:hypothetical protein [Alphaproteobacteria bacterium]